MIESYQERADIGAVEPESASFATIGAVHADGVTLIFDGQTSASQKHYKVNTSVLFAAGDRVRVVKDGGTYIVEYVIGNPITRLAAGSLRSAGAANGTEIMLRVIGSTFYIATGASGWKTIQAV